VLVSPVECKVRRISSMSVACCTSGTGNAKFDQNVSNRLQNETKLGSLAGTSEEPIRFDLVVCIGRVNDGRCSCVLCVVLCCAYVQLHTVLVR
jgi:hypothetical protein